MHWRNSVGIPIIVVLGVYFVSLATCLLYRRRRKASKANKAAAAARETRRRDQKRSASSVLLPPPEVTHDGRHPSVSSIGTAQTLTEDEPYYVRKKDLEMGSGGSGSSGSSGSRSAGCRSCGSCGGGTSGRSGGGRGRGSSRSAAYVLRNHPQQPPPTNPGVAWNRVVWRRESSAEYPLPVPTPSMYGTPVAGDWDYRAPIGQAL